MANPRALPDFTELRAQYTAFLRKTSSTGAIDYLPSASNPYPSATTTQQDNSVTMDTNGQVKVGSSGDPLVGRLDRSSNDGTCSVQTAGVAKFAYTAGATAPVLGRGVVCDGSGGVAIAASGSEWKERGQVWYLDTTNHYAWVNLGGGYH